MVGNILNQEQRCLLNEHESQETCVQLKAVESMEYETRKAHPGSHLSCPECRTRWVIQGIQKE